MRQSLCNLSIKNKTSEFKWEWVAQLLEFSASQSRDMLGMSLRGMHVFPISYRCQFHSTFLEYFELLLQIWTSRNGQNSLSELTLLWVAPSFYSILSWTRENLKLCFSNNHFASVSIFPRWVFFNKPSSTVLLACNSGWQLTEMNNLSGGSSTHGLTLPSKELLC